jgi:opacity protein-like surface antigen
MKKTAFAVSIFLLSVCMVILPIKDAPAQTSPFYVGVFGGYVMPEDMHFNVNTAAVSFDVATDSTGIIGFKFGYVLPAARFLALEMEFNHMFEHNYGPTTVSGVIEAGDVYLSNFFFNALLRYPDGKIHPYVGAGIGSCYFHIKGTETYRGVTLFAEEEDYSFAWQFLAGVNFEIANNLSVDLGYRYYGTDASLLITDIEYRANIITAGINFHF